MVERGDGTGVTTRGEGTGVTGTGSFVMGMGVTGMGVSGTGKLVGLPVSGIDPCMLRCIRVQKPMSSVRSSFDLFGLTTPPAATCKRLLPKRAASSKATIS